MAKVSVCDRKPTEIIKDAPLRLVSISVAGVDGAAPIPPFEVKMEVCTECAEQIIKICRQRICLEKAPKESVEPQKGDSDNK